jgi:Zn-dependent peptidase ImmA (M78 family)
MSQEDIARRVADSIPAARTQAQVADQIGLTDEKLSKSLRGRRAFSSVELARLAEALTVDVHWLITGRPDPNRLVGAARHDFDHATGRRDVPGRDTDQPVLDDVALAYRQAFPAWGPVDMALPGTVVEVKSKLGPNFVRRMADRFESDLDVDVIRLSEVSTAYSFHVGPRKVIVLQATGNWFRENWSLAHELGHLVSGHHADDLTPAEQYRHELVANGIAAELLLPEAGLREVNWQSLTERELAELIWEWGVSTDALARRLEGLGLTVSDTIGQALQLSTQKLLRWHWAGQHDHGPDQITVRMDQAATRRFPLKLQEAHTDLIASGALHKGTLAWMLGIDPDALEVDEPPPPEPLDTDQLAAALGL